MKATVEKTSKRLLEKTSEKRDMEIQFQNERHQLEDKFKFELDQLRKQLQDNHADRSEVENLRKEAEALRAEKDTLRAEGWKRI